jgi:hypothetical protein
MDFGRSGAVNEALRSRSATATRRFRRVLEKGSYLSMPVVWEHEAACGNGVSQVGGRLKSGIDLDQELVDERLDHLRDGELACPTVPGEPRVGIQRKPKRHCSF